MTEPVFTPEQEVRVREIVSPDGIAVRLECLKLALSLHDRDLQRAIALAAAFEREVTSGFAGQGHPLNGERR